MQFEDEFIDAPGSIGLIRGAGGGKGGGGHTAQEAENTLRSAAVVRVVEVISEGPIEGLAGGGAGIYINDTPMFNQDGTTNFPRVQWDYRIGLPDQDYMPGFSAVEAEISVATNVTIVTNDIIRTVSATNIDAVRVAILLGSGLSEQDLSNGDLNGSQVTFRIDTRLGSGTWSEFGTFTITGKTTTAYEAQYRVPRPSGTGLWSVRVHRISADPAANVHNQTTWSRMTEIQEIQVSYPDAAVVGVAIDAETVGNQIPTRGYLVKGVLVDIPSNYNPVTRAYTGIWNGLFTPATIACDNPVWVLYDMMTNERYGAGIDPADIDKYSFYDASVYCDALITFVDENGASSQEPRYTFNARFADRSEMLALIKSVCGAMGANLIFWNGKWTIIQDRPTSVTKVITKANVIEGLFTYKSSGLFERHTAVNVSYNDRGDRYLERVATVEDTTAIDRYGYNSVDIAAFGCTTEGQAIRAGRWLLDSEQNQSELVEFKMLLNGLDIMPGDVVSIFDEDYANTTGAGRVVSYTAASTTVVLDRACVITTGSTISALLADGRTIETRNIVGTGTLSTITISSAFSTALMAQADFAITSAVAPRPFRVVDITVPDPGVVLVKGAFYDANKYTRIETGVTVPSSQFSNQIRTVVPSPSGLSLTLEGQIIPATGLPRRYIRADWTGPTTSVPIAGYNVTWSRSANNKQSTQAAVNTCQIPADEDGIYTVSVFARDFNNNVSALPVTTTLTVTSNALTVDPTGFGSVINLVCNDSNGTSWVQNDMVFHWSDNPTNTRPAVAYKVEIYTTSDTLLRTVEQPIKQFTYSLSMNTTDGSGTPRNSLKVKVYAKDAQGAYAIANTQTFTNAAPAAVTGFTVDAIYKAGMLKWNANTESDLQGYYIWRGASSGFAPSSGNLVFKGYATQHMDGVLSDVTTYFWKIAAFDNFNHNEDGTNLNITTITATSPGSPTAYTSEYEFLDFTWTPNSPTANKVAWTTGTAYQRFGTGSPQSWTITASNATWTTGTLYIYWDLASPTTFQSTTSITTATGPDKRIVALYKGGTSLNSTDGNHLIDASTTIIPNTISAPLLVTGSAVITNVAQMGSATVGTAAIADAAITNAKIGGTIQSDNWNGAQGWLIAKDGTAFFNRVSLYGVVFGAVNVPNNTFVSVNHHTGRYVAVSLWSGNGSPALVSLDGNQFTVRLDFSSGGTVYYAYV